MKQLTLSKTDVFQNQSAINSLVSKKHWQGVMDFLFNSGADATVFTRLKTTFFSSSFFFPSKLFICNHSWEPFAAFMYDFCYFSNTLPSIKTLERTACRVGGRSKQVANKTMSSNPFWTTRRVPGRVRPGPRDPFHGSPPGPGER